MNKKMLPCPFCGGEEIGLFVRDGVMRYYWYECAKCYCGTGHEESEDEARAAWNRRAQPESELPASSTPTNAQRIRGMSDEELAEFLSNIRDCGDYDELKLIGGVRMDYVSVIEWLQQPVETEGTE